VADAGIIRMWLFALGFCCAQQVDGALEFPKTYAPAL
jgi:hypothetical protein